MILIQNYGTTIVIDIPIPGLPEISNQEHFWIALENHCYFAFAVNMFIQLDTVKGVHRWTKITK